MTTARPSECRYTAWLPWYERGRTYGKPTPRTVLRRVLCEQLDEIAKKLGGGKPIAPEVLEELVVRLLTPAVMLLRHHVVNKRGQCKYCGWDAVEVAVLASTETMRRVSGTEPCHESGP